jgi:hypothetical protein
MVTISEKIQEESKRLNEWINANPGIPLVCGPDAVERVFFERSLLDSPAFRKLSRGALLIYLDFLSKRQMEKDKITKHWYIKNNGEIVYPYSEAQKKGITETQFRDWIDELIASGLLGLSHQGKGGRKPKIGKGDISKYFISERWKKFGDDDFKPESPRKKDNRKGRGFSLIWDDPVRREAMLKKRSETIERKKRQKDADKKQM